MYVVVTGMSHKTAPLDLRERLTLDDAAALAVERDLLEQGAACEALVLSTCNRTEVYLYAGDSLAARQAAVRRLAAQAAVSAAELEARIYSHSGDAAIAHLFRVAASLDSMVVGEAQIVAQIKRAYQQAAEGGCTNVVFNRLFRQALEVGKRVRTETTIGERPVSVSSAAVELASQVFGKFRDHVALILGAGETSELTATHLRGRGIGHILVANRTEAAAEQLAACVGGRPVAFAGLEEHLAQADIVISSTSAPGFVVTRESVARAMRRRRHRPLFFVDIAVPRDIDPEVGRIDDVFLYDLDDLREVVEQNRGEREREAALAEAVVQDELAKVNGWLRTLDVVPTIAMLRESVEGIRDAEFARLGKHLADLSDEQRAGVELLTNSIVNKILHVPTVRMKEVAGRQECYLYVDALRTLFGLNGAGTAGDEEGRQPGTDAADVGREPDRDGDPE